MLAEKLIEKLGPLIVKQVTALLPVIAAAVAKTISDQLKLHIPELHLPAIPDLAEDVRKQLNNIPDVDIGPLSEIFDVSEWLKGKLT
jgi:hypothetical protein